MRAAPRRHAQLAELKFTTTVHGGFWRARYDLSEIGDLCEALTGQGLATWSWNTDALEIQVEDGRGRSTMYERACRIWKRSRQSDHSI
jgi:hypothetical protein